MNCELCDGTKILHGYHEFFFFHLYGLTICPFSVGQKVRVNEIRGVERWSELRKMVGKGNKKQYLLEQQKANIRYSEGLVKKNSEIEDEASNIKFWKVK